MLRLSICLAAENRISGRHSTLSHMATSPIQPRWICRSFRFPAMRGAGVDGKYNDGARKVLNYLLHGCCGSEIYSASRCVAPPSFRLRPHNIAVPSCAAASAWHGRTTSLSLAQLVVLSGSFFPEKVDLRGGWRSHSPDVCTPLSESEAFSPFAES